MQTEIDHFLTAQKALLKQQNSTLAEENKALSQQVDSLKSILTGYSKLEQELETKIQNLQLEKATQQALISALKDELSKIEQGSFSQDLQRNFQTNLMSQLQTQLTQALNQLNLNDIINNLVQTAISPVQKTISAQQTDLEKALLKLSQFKISPTIDDELQTQSKRIMGLEIMLGDLITLIEKLNR